MLSGYLKRNRRLQMEGGVILNLVMAHPSIFIESHSNREGLLDSSKKSRYGQGWPAQSNGTRQGWSRRTTSRALQPLDGSGHSGFRIKYRRTRHHHVGARVGHQRRRLLVDNAV